MKVAFTIFRANLFTIFAFIILAPPQVSAQTLIDSYSEANYTATASLNDTRTVVGQVFTPSVSAYIRSSKFYISKENSPTGTIVSKLYAVTGTPGSTAVPTGSPLAVSAGVNVSTLSSWPTQALATFNFTPNGYLMSAGVPYAIVLEYTGGTSTNDVPVGKNNMGTHPGNKTEMDMGVWIADADYDTIFYVYGDVPGTLQLSTATYSVNENGGSATITITRTAGSSGAVGAHFATSNGTATAGSDYTAVTQTVSFADGDATNKTIAIPVLDDVLVEANETVNLTLSSPTGGATLGNPATAVLTIIDNDAPAPTLIDSYSEAHENGTATLNDTRTAVGQVFTPSVSAYIRSSKFYLSKENSPTGTILAKLYAVTGTPGSTAVATGSPLAISVGLDVSTLSPWPTLALVTFNFTPNGYLMTAGVPYAIVVEYSGGSSTNDVPVGKDNAGTHPGNKTEFNSGVWIPDADFDTIFYVYGDLPNVPGTLQFSTATYSVNENGGGATITITRTGGKTGAVGAHFATSNGTATAGADYTAVTQTVSFADGDATNKTVAIPILDDMLVEANETVNLTLSSPTGGATLGNPAATVLTIIDNDGPPPTLIDSYSEANQNGTATINGTRTAVGQIFTPSVSAYIRSSKFYLSKENSPTGTIVAKLYAVTGTPGSTAVATGSPLAISAGLDVSTLSAWPTLALVTFDFTLNGYLMSAGVPYAIVVEYPGGSSTNTVPVGIDTSGTHPGNKAELNSGFWIADADFDTIFYVYGDVVRKGRGQITSQ